MSGERELYTHTFSVNKDRFDETDPDLSADGHTRTVISRKLITLNSQADFSRADAM